jgi:type III pantothenate kinase
VKTGFPIKIDSPSELGGDMVADTAAVLQRMGQKRKAAIIADLGTVTTVSAVNASGEYVGCCIVPGVGISFESLHGKTAQLPNVMLSDAGKAIGKNSQDAVRSGVILGHAMMLDGFVGRFAKEMRCRAEEVQLMMTGEYASLIVNACRCPFETDPDLTLKGLFVLYQNTVQNL